MDQVENKDVMQEEIVAPKTEAVQDETPVQQEASQSVVDEKQERNWRELRRTKDELEKKARMQEEIIQRLMTQSLNVQPQQSQQSVEEDIISQIQREEYVPGDKVAKALHKIKADVISETQKLREEQAKLQKNAQLMGLKAEYPDFDSVVTPENLEILEETNPKLAKIIAKSSDAYDMAVQSYEWIKSHGIVEKTSSRRVKEVDQKIEQNKKTVQSPQAFDKRPMAQAFKAPDKEEQKRLFAEMNHFASQAGGGY